MAYDYQVIMGSNSDTMTIQVYDRKEPMIVLGHFCGSECFKETKHWYWTNMFVDELHRKRHLATGMLNRMCMEMDKLGIVTTELSCKDILKPFYKKAGFLPHGDTMVRKLNPTHHY